MKIVAPITRAENLQILADAGASEFFGGVYDTEWERLYGNAIEYNRRGSYGKKANFASWDELKLVIEQCRAQGLRFSLTANALRFSEMQMPAMRQILERYCSIGGTDIIISDPILCMIAREYNLTVTVSSCANCFSQETTGFYAVLGCDGIIFPRDMTLQEMKAIKQAYPQLHYEAFLMYSGCRYNDGNCRALHNTAYRELCQFCDTGDWYYQRRDGGIMTADEAKYVRTCGDAYAVALKNACGQCALYRLSGIVDRVKVLERADALEKLVRAIHLTKQNLAAMEACQNEVAYLERVVRPEHVVCDADCYYPDYYREIEGQSNEQELGKETE